MAAPTTGLTIVTAFTYRGKAGEEWSNHYWFTGATPADSTAWRALFDALVLEHFEPCGPVFGNQHVVAVAPEHDRQQLAHRSLVVDDEHPRGRLGRLGSGSLDLRGH